jgi:hypothetical protein
LTTPAELTAKRLELLRELVPGRYTGGGAGEPGQSHQHLFISQDGFFVSRRLQLANMAARHALPMTSGSRDIAEVGGLMSYGTNIPDVYRQMGLYTGRILKGTKPADLPVEQSAKYELVTNAQSAAGPRIWESPIVQHHECGRFPQGC